MSAKDELIAYLDRENPGHDTCEFCRSLTDVAIYGRAMRTPEQVFAKRDTWCRQHKQDMDDMLRDAVMALKKRRDEP